MNRQWNPCIGIALAALALAGCASMAREQNPDYAAVVAAPDRSAADRKTDERRKPAELLAFAGVGPGMKVLDMGAGGGYSTELLARAVAPGGVVYAQDAPDGNERALAAFKARSQSPAMKNVVRVLRPYEDPVPPGVSDLDVITYFFEYHEAANMGIDRVKMDRRLFDALKPGGILIVADHSAQAGTGTAATHSLHRIDEALVRREFEAAGFRLAGEGEFLRSPGDKRDVIVFKSPVPVDDFVLKFQKPG